MLYLMYSQGNNTTLFKGMLVHLFLLIALLLCAGRDIFTFIDALPVPQAVATANNPLLSPQAAVINNNNTQIIGSAEPVVNQPQVIATSNNNLPQQAAVINDNSVQPIVSAEQAVNQPQASSTPSSTALVTDTPSTVALPPTDASDVTVAPNLLDASAKTGPTTIFSIPNNVQLDKTTVVKALVPEQLQSIVDPQLETDPAATNMTRTETRKHAIFTKGIPFAIAAGAGLASSIAAETAIVGSTVGLAAVPGVFAAGMVGSTVFNTTYTFTNRIARKIASQSSDSDVDTILDGPSSNHYNKTLESERVNAEIEAEKNRPFSEKVKDMLPLVIAGGIGNVAGTAVSSALAPSIKNAVSHPFGAEASKRATGMTTSVVTTNADNSSPNSVPLNTSILT
ncbi:hypothetical protein BDF19DRAFT_454170 [Syncephalis fuscata]|nr:hypothetical protein BDF19DRAFT_454170 [Syncephalis fuscata]